MQQVSLPQVLATLFAIAADTEDNLERILRQSAACQNQVRADFKATAIIMSHVTSF